MLKLLEVCNLPSHIPEFCLQSTPHRCTRLHVASPQIQQTSNLAEFESQALDAAYESQRFDIAFAVLAEASLRPWRARQQCAALVEPNRIGRQPYSLCNATNVHRFAPLFRIYTLENSPESSPLGSSRTFLIWGESRTSQNPVPARESSLALSKAGLATGLQFWNPRSLIS